MIYQSPITPLRTIVPNTLYYMHLRSILGSKLTIYQLPFYMINAPSSTSDRFMVQTGLGRIGRAIPVPPILRCGTVIGSVGDHRIAFYC